VGRRNSKYRHNAVRLAAIDSSFTDLLNMNQNISANQTKKELFVLRLCTVYFLLYIIFVGQPLGGYYQLFDIYQYSGEILYKTSLSFLRLINYLFLHRVINGDEDISADSFWGYIIIISLFVISLLIALIWSAVAKKKRHPKLFYYLHTITRYYLAFSLLAYGISKIFWNQFFIPDWGLVTTLSDLVPQHVLWSFMATSRSYQFFGGLMEIIPALFLLFRRTSVLGALLAIAVLINILMLNIGYDVSLKLILFHLIVFAVYVLAPNIKKLFSFFVLNQNIQLTKVQPVIVAKKKKRLYLILKLCLIVSVVFTDIKTNVDRINEKARFPAASILGMHQIGEYHIKQDSLPCDLVCWKKINISPDNQVFIQYMNDSIAYYASKLDTTKRSLELLSKDDSLFKCRLNYNKVSSDKWMFRGTLKNDPVSFVATKIDLNNSNLLKDLGKVKWVF
jgi:hypothetical protein